MKIYRLAVVVCMGMGLSACALQTPRVDLSGATPPQWYAPLPHRGTVTDLWLWWSRQGDPLLVDLITSAQAVSPTIAAARTRIEQARATRVAAGASLLPRLDATADATKSSAQPPVFPANTLIQGALQASWELDLFGANRANRRSAQARLEGARAGWHEARVSVAAEVANIYYSLRACERLLEITRSDAISRSETARLTGLSAEAGFVAPSTSALARASAADGDGRVAQQQAQCDLNVKALVALSAMAEPELRHRLGASPSTLAPATDMAIDSVPARILSQRPDVFSAERELTAASFEVGGTEALRYPRLTLNGSVGASRFSTGSVSMNNSTWSIGPLSLTVPLFDGGRSAANLQAAQARYAEASIKYRSAVRNAVREVEEALVNLHSTGARSEYAAIAVDGFRAAFAGTESRYQSGLASLVELEQARRDRLSAEIALVSLQQTRMAAWIALYRAAGGGWDSTQLAVPQLTAQTGPVVEPVPFWKAFIDKLYENTQAEAH